MSEANTTGDTTATDAVEPVDHDGGNGGSGGGPTIRLLAIAVANGFSSEVRVMSTLLGQAPEIDAEIIVNQWKPDDNLPDRVRKLSGAPVHALDLGWRPLDVTTRLDRVRRVASILTRAGLAFPRVVRIARDQRPDVVYSSQQKWDSLVAGLVAALLRRPHVVHLHYIPGPWLGKRMMRKLRTGPVITVSQYIRGLAIDAGADPARVRPVLNPIDPYPEDARAARSATREAMGIADDEVVIGFISRLSPTKGQIETLRALAELGPVAARTRLVLVGGGEIEEELRELADELGLADRVIFTGLRNDIPELLGSFDIFAHPSFQDPCPLAVLEAQAAALPTVAFDEGGISEIVADETTGLLAPDRDVSELAERLRRLIEDPELRSRMGPAARERAGTVFRPARSGATFVSALRDLV